MIALIDTFDVGVIVARVLEDTVEENVVEEDSVKYWLDFSELLENPVLLKIMEPV